MSEPFFMSNALRVCFMLFVIQVWAENNRSPECIGKGSKGKAARNLKLLKVG